MPGRKELTRGRSKAEFATMLHRAFLAFPLALAIHGGSGGAWAQEAEKLFASHDLLEFTLQADFDQLNKDRGQESEERPGTLILAGPLGAGGDPVSLEMSVKTRGDFRLQKRNCPFPPLRLNLPEASPAGTIFDGQDKLKLVTHCRDRDDFEQNILEEYLAYRIFNLFTDRSFQVRLARITYTDVNGKVDPVTRLAFLIEDEDDLAGRLNGMMLEVPAVHSEDYEPMAAGLLYVFQYLIGNVDWSVTHFHNVKLLRVGMDHFPVPYDFDWSGLVDAPYAEPHPTYAEKIRTVRDRLYCGSCSARINYATLFRQFNEKREDIRELIEAQTFLTERNREDAQEYIDGFYEVINDPGRAERQIVRACSGG
jgi:hypothetical protein